jgi:hypothetical protein
MKPVLHLPVDVLDLVQIPDPNTRRQEQKQEWSTDTPQVVKRRPHFDDELERLEAGTGFFEYPNSEFPYFGRRVVELCEQKTDKPFSRPSSLSARSYERLEMSSCEKADMLSDIYLFRETENISEKRRTAPCSLT